MSTGADCRICSTSRCLVCSGAMGPPLPSLPSLSFLVLDGSARLSTTAPAEFGPELSCRRRRWPWPNGQHSPARISARKQRPTRDSTVVVCPVPLSLRVPSQASRRLFVSSLLISTHARTYARDGSSVCPPVERVRDVDDAQRKPPHPVLLCISSVASGQHHIPQEGISDQDLSREQKKGKKEKKEKKRHGWGGRQGGYNTIVVGKIGRAIECSARGTVQEQHPSAHWRRARQRQRGRRRSDRTTAVLGATRIVSCVARAS